MICAMSPPRTGTDYLEAWTAFQREVEDKSQPECRFCGIRHAREDWHPYCTMARRFFLWCRRESGAPDPPKPADGPFVVARTVPGITLSDREDAA